MGAYYNENDPFAAAWLRELIKAGHIAPGEVDTRSIEDVAPTDLSGFTQCHFFAGIGVWSYALRCAGWPDDMPVWTGSCPCQPFSCAGKGKGFSDERHLWPAFFNLISERRPVTIFGEQVGSKDGLTWLDLVHTNLEDAGYTVGAVNTPAAGFGAPHIRQRLYWVADLFGGQRKRRKIHIFEGKSQQAHTQATRSGCLGRLADASSPRYQRALKKSEEFARDEARLCMSGAQCGTIRLDVSVLTGLERFSRDDDSTEGRKKSIGSTTTAGKSCGLDDTIRNRRQARRNNDGEHDRQQPCSAIESCYKPTASQINGHWKNADWLFCRDGKWRPVEAGTFPLAHGSPARVVRLRGYGNAINAEQAKAFIMAFVVHKNQMGFWNDPYILTFMNAQ